MSAPPTPAATECRNSRSDARREEAPGDENTYVITVAIVEGAARDPLLTGATTLHRRGVSLVEAELSRPTNGRHILSATFNAHERQAQTVLRTFANQVEVLDAELFQAFDGRERNAMTETATVSSSSARGGGA